MEIQYVVEVVINIIKDFCNNMAWIVNPFSVLGITIPSPLFIISFGSLTVILSIAVTKWILSH